VSLKLQPWAETTPPPTTSAPGTAPASTEAPAGHHILLVEDSVDDATLVMIELRKIGRRLEFRRVDTEPDLRQALAERSWDIVISDHRMPTLDAIQAYNIVRRSGADSPFIILSGAIAEQTAIKAMRLGAHDFIDKSNLARLVPVVERELRHAGLRRSKEHVERSLVHLTYHDQLTGLPNRQMLSQLLEHSLAEQEPGLSGVTLLHIDLYRFMRVNESLGIGGGDALLTQVAARLSKGFIDNGTVAHLGQDKFAVLLDGGGDADARAHAEAALAVFAGPFDFHGEEVHLACAIGVCRYPAYAHNASELLRNAECAMAEAKRAGAGSIRHYAQAANTAYGNPLRLENALRHAVARQQLYLDYQPCLDTVSGRMTGTEALVRWRHPTYGVMPPDTFIPLADETGLIVDVGHWVLREACRQNRAWHDAGRTGLTVAVNVSAAQFRRADFADRVAVAIAESGMDPHFLELEITETVVMQDAETNIRTLRKIKNMGARIAIDDFGTGYSSLSYLKRLPIDILKIDRSFLQNLMTDSDNQAIVRLIVALAKSLKLTLIAEGVEARGQLVFLRDLGCDRAQGFFIGRPLPPAAIAALSVLDLEGLRHGAAQTTT
jgi:diguanylate cyclase (GGDEF)-like protein